MPFFSYCLIYAWFQTSLPCWHSFRPPAGIMHSKQYTFQPAWLQALRPLLRHIYFNTPKYAVSTVQIQPKPLQILKLKILFYCYNYCIFISFVNKYSQNYILYIYSTRIPKILLFLQKNFMTSILFCQPHKNPLLSILSTQPFEFLFKFFTFNANIISASKSYKQVNKYYLILRTLYFKPFQTLLPIINDINTIISSHRDQPP